MLILYASDTHVTANHLEHLLALGGKRNVHPVIVGGDIIPVRSKSVAEGIVVERLWVEQVLLFDTGDIIGSAYVIIGGSEQRLEN